MEVEHAALQPSPVGIVGHKDTAIWTEKLSGNKIAFKSSTW